MALETAALRSLLIFTCNHNASQFYACKWEVRNF
jgi:hypothetical protein